MFFYLTICPRLSASPPSGTHMVYRKEVDFMPKKQPIVRCVYSPDCGQSLSDMLEQAFRLYLRQALAQPQAPEVNGHAQSI